MDMPNKYRNCDEYKIQGECLVWFSNKYPNYRKSKVLPFGEGFANSILTPTQMKIKAGQLKARGLERGISDNILLIPNKHYHGICPECKTPIGVQSDHQKEFEAYCKESGYYYFIYRSVEQFKSEIEQYLEQI